MSNRTTTQQLEKFYDIDASRYRDAQWFASIPARSFFGATKRVLMNHLQLTGNERILEIGCGPGTWTKELRPDCQSITAIDLSQKMIGEAQSYAGIQRIRYWHGDFMAFDADGERYDRIVTVRVFEYVKDKHAFVTKCMQLLRPKGRLVIITKSPTPVWTKRMSLYGVARKLFPTRVNKELDKPVDAGYAGLFWQQMVYPTRLAAWMRSNGFESIVSEPIQLRLPVVAGGLGEIPLLTGKAADLYLRISDRATQYAINNHPGLIPAMCLMTEAYAIAGNAPAYDQGKSAQCISQ